MKKLVIALVCVGLLVALTIPSIYSASKWGTYTLTLTSEDVQTTGGVIEDCKASKRCISSGYWETPIELVLSSTFGDFEDSYDTEGIVLSENKGGEITMQFFFFDQKGKKVVLKVEGGCVSVEGWLSSSFTIEFVKAYAVITPATKGKKKILWDDELVDITIKCQGE